MTSIERFFAGLALVAVLAYLVQACGCGGEVFTASQPLTVDDGGQEGGFNRETGDANGGDGGIAEDSAHPDSDGGTSDGQTADVAPAVDSGGGADGGVGADAAADAGHDAGWCCVLNWSQNINCLPNQPMACKPGDSCTPGIAHASCTVHLPGMNDCDGQMGLCQ